MKWNEIMTESPVLQPQKVLVDLENRVVVEGRFCLYVVLSVKISAVKLEKQRSSYKHKGSK